jgi:hypothetical protein
VGKKEVERERGGDGEQIEAQMIQRGDIGISFMIGQLFV